jgi:hypothetical protein
LLQREGGKILVIGLLLEDADDGTQMTRMGRGLTQMKDFLWDGLFAGFVSLAAGGGRFVLAVGDDGGGLFGAAGGGLVV